MTSGRIKGGGAGFEPEYVPLLEFALEINRHPSLEDKKHLAGISGLSYRQVKVWFQNHRSRKDTPAKSKRVRPPAPKTFEEMKERLGDSARETLSKAHPLLKKINLDPTEHYGDTPPELSTHAASSGVTEDAPSPGSCSDERVELTDYGLLPWHTATTPSTLKTSVHAYPAVYQPSQLTSDPCVIAPHAWLRDRRANMRESIDPMPEAVADTLSGFGRMDLDEPSKKMKKSRKKFNSEKKLSVVEAHVIGATTHDTKCKAHRNISREHISTSTWHTAQFRGAFAAHRLHCMWFILTGGT
ncbi:hypothetical protein JB92DRAFT_3098152 [Gautieria morchelliformis]|nr:hypothetical protein JB92DRAFT_3098152 [Gautieria morchelliformis]